LTAHWEKSMATAAAEIDVLDAALEWSHDELGLTYDELGHILEVSDRTLRRWRSGSAQPRKGARARIEDLNELRHLLEAAFPDSSARRAWVQSRSGMLRGRTPISLLRAGKVMRVCEALAAFEDGAFA